MPASLTSEPSRSAPRASWMELSWTAISGLDTLEDPHFSSGWPLRAGPRQRRFWPVRASYLALGGAARHVAAPKVGTNATITGVSLSFVTSFRGTGEAGGHAIGHDSGSERPSRLRS